MDTKALATQREGETEKDDQKLPAACWPMENRRKEEMRLKLDAAGSSAYCAGWLRVSSLDLAVGELGQAYYRHCPGGRPITKSRRNLRSSSQHCHRKNDKSRGSETIKRIATDLPPRIEDGDRRKKR